LIYSVRHITTFRYQPAVRESVMEVRMQPRNEANQRCLSFTLDVNPPANITQYRDFTGNTVHHFDIAGSHTEVKVTAQSMVQVQPVPEQNAPSVVIQSRPILARLSSRTDHEQQQQQQ
jgi:transglutaminase-like putative cysteine protease